MKLWWLEHTSFAMHNGAMAHIVCRTQMNVSTSRTAMSKNCMPYRRQIFDDFVNIHEKMKRDRAESDPLTVCRRDTLVRGERHSVTRSSVIH